MSKRPPAPATPDGTRRDASRAPSSSSTARVDDALQRALEVPTVDAADVVSLRSDGASLPSLDDVDAVVEVRAASAAPMPDARRDGTADGASLPMLDDAAVLSVPSGAPLAPSDEASPPSTREHAREPLSAERATKSPLDVDPARSPAADATMFVARSHPRARQRLPTVVVVAASLLACALAVALFVVERPLLQAALPAPLRSSASSSALQPPSALQIDASSPHGAIASLRQALRAGDDVTARALVDVAVWPTTQPHPPSALRHALAARVFEDGAIPWTARADDSASMTWTDDALLPALRTPSSLALTRAHDAWLVSSLQTPGTDALRAADEVLHGARAAIEARDGRAFIALVHPGPTTCIGQACLRVQRAVEEGRRHPLVDALRDAGLVPGSWRAQEAGKDVRVRILRRTQALDLVGVVQFVVGQTEPRAGAPWLLQAIDTTHFDAINEEADAWVDAQAALAWRADVASTVDVTTSPKRCERQVLAWCASEIEPTRVRNVGRVGIARVQVSKVGGVVGAGVAAWAVFRAIKPGTSTEQATETSQPVNGKRFEDVRGFDRYRVDWIELDDGRRLSADARRLEPAHGVTELEEARRRARADVSRMQALRARVQALGYSDDDTARLLAAPH